jgi:hypothetical protein
VIGHKSVALQHVRSAQQGYVFCSRVLTESRRGRTHTASKRHGAVRMIRVNRNMEFTIKFYTADPSARSCGVVAVSVREENAL